jgi:hypothetical protein
LEASPKPPQPLAPPPPPKVEPLIQSTPIVAGALSAAVATAPPPAEAGQPDAKSPSEVDPGSDHTPPVLAALRFDPPVVEGGSVTTLTVEATDDLSGVKSVRGEIRSPNGLALLPFVSQDAVSGDVRTFAITIPREAESGVWYVSWISVTDGAANPLLLQARSAVAAPPGGSFTVSSSESDSAAPEVLQVWFDKASVAGGEKNVIRVDARDDRSGVVSITGACQSPSKSALIWFECALNEGSGTWEGTVPVPTNAECGEWGIARLAVKDKAGNTNLLTSQSSLLARAAFGVDFRSDCDSAPPTLDAIDLSPTMVSSETATEILTTATVHDDQSGTAKLTGWFDGPAANGGQVPKIYFQCAPDPGDPAAPWAGKILVPQHAATGTWKVGVIRLEDKALNVREYTAADREVSRLVFEVR